LAADVGASVGRRQAVASEGQFVVGLHERLGVDVPESDYARLRTLTGCCAYLEAHLPQAKPST
jgi:hypothetical protein